MRDLAVVGLILLASPLGAAERSLPARHEPLHKVVFENNYVRVIDVQIPAARETLFHRHDIASVMVYLTNTTNESQTFGESTWTPRTVSPGDSRYAAYDEKPLHHRVRNPGPGLFRVYDIELLHSRLTAKSFTLAESPALRAQWQQKSARSLTLRLNPEAHRTVPPGPCAYLFVQISGVLTVAAANGAPRELPATEIFFQPAGAGFLLSNGGKEPLETVLLELR